MKRYPFKLPAWVFWVLVVLVASLVSQVPAVGPVLALALVGVALWWFFKRVAPERDRAYADYAPKPITGVAELALDRLEVRGEASYYVGIARAVSIAGRDLAAILAWEPKNPHSTNGNAVRVDLAAGDERITCGYVPAEHSAAIAAEVRANADKGLATAMSAAVFGGTADKPNYGVVLGTGVRPPTAWDRPA
ncbi:hypothetical protein [Microbacterium sp. KNMS]